MAVVVSKNKHGSVWIQNDRKTADTDQGQTYTTSRSIFKVQRSQTCIIIMCMNNASRLITV